MLPRSSCPLLPTSNCPCAGPKAGSALDRVLRSRGAGVVCWDSGYFPVYPLRLRPSTHIEDFAAHALEPGLEFPLTAEGGSRRWTLERPPRCAS